MVSIYEIVIFETPRTARAGDRVKFFFFYIFTDSPSVCLSFILRAGAIDFNHSRVLFIAFRFRLRFSRQSGTIERGIIERALR